MSENTEPPTTKYELTVRIRGNSHEEIESELLTLTRGGYLLDSDYHKRDEFDCTDGRVTARLIHKNPEQTAERYREELDAWWNNRKAETRPIPPADPCQRRPHYGDPCDCEARLALVVTHTRTSTPLGPDYCAECSEAISEWVPWPCEATRPIPPAGGGA